MTEKRKASNTQVILVQILLLVCQFTAPYYIYRFLRIILHVQAAIFAE